MSEGCGAYPVPADAGMICIRARGHKGRHSYRRFTRLFDDVVHDDLAMDSGSVAVRDLFKTWREIRGTFEEPHREFVDKAMERLRLADGEIRSLKQWESIHSVRHQAEVAELKSIIEHYRQGGF